MPMYILEIEGGEPLSINARDDDGAKALVRSCLTGEMPSDARVLLSALNEAHVVIDAHVGELFVSSESLREGMG